MSPRTKEKFEEIREGKRREILDAALECFATTGYHAVSISNLAKHAGISKGLLYNYFTGKEDLLRYIFREIMDMMMALINPDGTGELDPDALLRYFDRLFDHLKSNLILWKMYMAIFSQPAVQQILSEDILEASQLPLVMASGYFKAQGYKDPTLEVAFLSTLISGVTYEFIADPEHYPLDAIKERIVDVYKLKDQSSKLKKNKKL